MSDAAARRAWEAMRALVLDHDRRKEVSDALGMSFIRVKALRALRDAPLTLRELAANLSIDPPYATVIVDDLAQRGLVTRTVHPDDRRARLVALTADGRAAAAEARRLLGQPPAALAGLPPAQLEALATLLEALGGADGPDSGAPA
jgi:DNA-binding MarR family transcriptional regulator